MKFSVFVVCFGLLGLVVSQPGVSFDESLTCWLNVTRDREVSYTPEELVQMNLYVNNTLYDPAADLLGDAGQILQIAKEVSDQLYYVMYPPVTLADYHIVAAKVPGDLFARYREDLMANKEVYYQLVFFSLQEALHLCAGGADSPRYGFTIKHIMESIVGGYFRENGVSREDVNEAIDQAAVALVVAWQSVNDTGAIDFESVALAIIEGVILAFEEYSNNDIAIETTAELVAQNILDQAPQGSTDKDAATLVREASDDLGIDIFAQNVMTSISEDLFVEDLFDGQMS